MIKKLLSATLVIAAMHVSKAQSFSLVYSFSNVTATSGTIDPTPTPTAIGVTSGSFIANGLSANPTTTNVFAFTQWPTGATTGNNTTFTGSIDPAKNFEITLTPNGGYAIDVNNIVFYTTRSGTGPRNWAVRSNLDAFAANLPADASMVTGTGTVITVQNGNTFFWSDDAKTSSAWFNTCKIDLSASNFVNLINPCTFKFYAWNSEGSAGSWRIDSVAINGSAYISTGLGKLTHDLNAKFKLFPNPSSDGVVTVEAISANVTKLEVINILGAVVASQNNLSENKIKLDLSSLPEGTYFVRIKAGDKITTEKLVISK